MAYSAIRRFRSHTDNMTKDIVDSLKVGYEYIIGKLYENTSFGYNKTNEEICDTLIEYGCPFNIRTQSFDGIVSSSIESDIIILETVSKIIGLMATCNQFIVPSPMHNVYVD